MSCRLSDATVNHVVGLLETSLVTSTAVASVSSIEYAADSAMTRKVLMGKRENAGLANNNERGAVDISKTRIRSAFAKPALAHAMYAPSLRVRNLTVGPKKRVSVS